MGSPRFFAFCLAWLLLACLPLARAQDKPPPSADEQPSLATRVIANASLRVRGEGLANDFRDQESKAGVFSRLLLGLSAERSFSTASRLVAAVEVADSRSLVGSEHISENATTTNPLDLLQAYALLQLDRSKLDFRAGRFTVDFGSRRLIARNRFRNTINAFSGIDLNWQPAPGHELRTLFLVPVRRDTEEAGLDAEDWDSQLFALSYSPPALREIEGQIFAVVLDAPSRQRISPGIWLQRKAQPGSFGGELEVVPQFGSSDELGHRALFFHTDLRYQLPESTSATTQIRVEYDYASGDRSLGDNRSGRFDTLFGARRFDFGPTGIYGPFARANLHSPGLRVQASSAAMTGKKSLYDGFVGYRAFFLSSSADAWIAAQRQDLSGNSGRFVAQQAELRGRWRPREKLQLELGGAFLFPDGFAQEQGVSGSTTYLYCAFAVTL